MTAIIRPPPMLDDAGLKISALCSIHLYSPAMKLGLLPHFLGLASANLQRPEVLCAVDAGHSSPNKLHAQVCGCVELNMITRNTKYSNEKPTQTYRHYRDH